MCVNEKSRYAIVVPLEEYKSLFILYVHLAQRICHAMRRLGIPDDVARRVLDEHRGGVRIAPTDNPINRVASRVLPIARARRPGPAQPA